MCHLVTQKSKFNLNAGVLSEEIWRAFVPSNLLWKTPAAHFTELPLSLFMYIKSVLFWFYLSALWSLATGPAFCTCCGVGQECFLLPYRKSIFLTQICWTKELLWANGWLIPHFFHRLLCIFPGRGALDTPNQ